MFRNLSLVKILFSRLSLGNGLASPKIFVAALVLVAAPAVFAQEAQNYSVPVNVEHETTQAPSPAKSSVEKNNDKAAEQSVDQASTKSSAAKASNTKAATNNAKNTKKTTTTKKTHTSTKAPAKTTSTKKTSQTNKTDSSVKPASEKSSADLTQKKKHRKTHKAA